MARPGCDRQRNIVRVSEIDQQANMFTLGRYAVCALSEQIDEHWRDGFQGSVGLADVIERATQENRDERYDTVREFVETFTKVAQ